jgi:hypothetical protein
MPLKTEGDGATLTISIYPYVYTKGGAYRYFAGQTVDLTSSVPGAGLIRTVLVYLDRDAHSLETIDGATVLDNGIIPVPRPTPPAGVDARESAWVTLANGQTTITTGTDVLDARDYLDNGQENALASPTAPGQVLMSDENLLPFWATPVISEDFAWMANGDGELIVEG